MKLRAALFLLAAGCLAVPDEQPVECKVTSDCDTANGEVCEDGTCWGNPPPGPFAVLVTPPSERKTELVSRELIATSLPADGYFGDLELGNAVTYTGQIVCPVECTTTELAATITVTRPSSFVGGPIFRQVFDTDPETGAFQLVLPPVGPDEPAYTVTITPDDRQQPRTDQSLARLVPPLRTTLVIEKNESGRTIDLGGEEDLLEITGTIVDPLGNAATNYRVVALGRWDETSPLSEVSTVDLINTTEQSFTIRLAEGLVGPVHLVAQPINDAIQPTLRLLVNPATASLVAPELVQPDTDNTVTLTFDVTGAGTGGEVAGVVGAHVTVRGQLAGDTEATFELTKDTDAEGRVDFDLPGGELASTYRVSVIPAADSVVGVVHDLELAGSHTSIRLPQRIAIVGTVLDVNGDPLKAVAVTASPSLKFQWSLSPAPQAFATGIPASSVLTSESGEFVLYVDPLIRAGDGRDMEEVWGHYDLSFVPSEAANAPLFTLFEVEVPDEPALTQLTIGSLQLPDAAHIHGRIVSPAGEVVEDAEIKLFRVEDQSAFVQFCNDLTNEPMNCPIPALQLGRGISDADGLVRFTLPR